MAKITISCAVTGAIHTPSMLDSLLIIPEEIARSSIEAAEAGAAINITTGMGLTMTLDERLAAPAILIDKDA